MNHFTIKIRAISIKIKKTPYVWWLAFWAMMWSFLFQPIVGIKSLHKRKKSLSRFGISFDVVNWYPVTNLLLITNFFTKWFISNASNTNKNQSMEIYSLKLMTNKLNYNEIDIFFSLCLVLFPPVPRIGLLCLQFIWCRLDLWQRFIETSSKSFDNSVFHLWLSTLLNRYFDK